MLYIQRFTGRQLPDTATVEELYQAEAEARFMRELEVGVMAEAVSMAFGGKRGKR